MAPPPPCRLTRRARTPARSPLALAAECIPSCPRTADPRAFHAAEARRAHRRLRFCAPQSCPPPPLTRQAGRAAPPQCYIHDGSVETARRIVRHEGWRALWRGTGPTLAMAVPSVAVYLPVYDVLQAHISAAGAPAAAPALAGAAARALAVLGTGA